ncbi:P-loop containing nucleoside triphosphate hydrolase protein [Diplogelasinospora grovesii]|uniref:P-loop containing nucleoside triphosphate hydrolase protein n=1 Tax=Diplogelasinospora grovesii TaxID=303347 RepID=A0AAN6N6Q7_9PEZI|nr:P-loop containing nucleoside triphosphate hydrolase protein [Diplogelasinospora grovesii]
MLITAAVFRCRFGQRRLLGISSQHTVRLPYQRLVALTHRYNSSHHAGHSPQDAKVEGIRNIGIIAHVDAGKTTTTERMLYHSGRTRHLGNVDHGNTITDFLPMERERGITIQSAAITFNWPPQQLCPPGEEPRAINLIDTPGHQDFRYEVDRCLPILDGAVCILDSVKGVETHTERVWESAQLSKIPRIIFVNKLDRDGASFKRSVQEVATRLKTWPLLCQIPWWNKDEFVGVVDIINGVGMRFSSTGAMSAVSAEAISQENPALRAEMDKARISLIETLSEHDDLIMEEFLEHEKDVSSASIKRTIRRLIMDGDARFSPVFAGASLRNMGVQPLLDAVIDYLPSPSDRPELEVMAGSKTYAFSQLLTQEAQKKGHNPHQPPIGALAHVFKVVDDPRRGMMSYVRVYHGSLGRSHQMWNSNIHGLEKPLNILHVSAKDYIDIPHLETGQIGAMTGLKSARTGDTLITFPGRQGAPEAFRSIRIKSPETPPAVAFIAIEPYTKTAGEKLEEALRKLSREDPSIRWSKDEKTEQLILSGMGLLHLEIAQDRLRTHYKIDKESAMWGDIEVEYQECLLSPTGAHRAEFDRPLRDKAGKAACTASLEPLEAHHHETLLESSIERDGNIIHIAIPLPTEDVKSLPFDPETVRQQLLNGAVAGLARGPRRSAPVRKCHVTITFDPETDFSGPNSSSGGHITNAALNAVRGALKEAHAQGQIGILEPFANVHISCPEEASNAIQHDLVSARGGQVMEVRNPNDDEFLAGGEGVGIDVSKVYMPPDPYDSIQSLRDPKKGAVRMLEIVGKAPLKEMMKYDSQLRSMTGGRHSLQLDPGTFELVTGPRERALESAMSI